MLATVQASSSEVGTASFRAAGLSSLERLEPGTGMVLDPVTRMVSLVLAPIGPARGSATLRRAANRARGLFVNAVEGAIRLGVEVRSRTILAS